jgi:hypothetical protein
MTAPANIIALSAPVAIEAGDSKRVPTFEAVIYTGGQLEISGWDLPVIIDLAGLTTGNVLVANLDHDSSKRVGNFTTTNDGSVLKASGFASAATPWRDEVVASAKAGYVWQASVEVQPKSVEPVKAGEVVEVNKRSLTGPAYITRRGVLKGFAFVSHGADDDTSVRIAAMRKGKAMSDSSFQTFISEMLPGTSTNDLTSDQLATLHANFLGRTNATDSDFAAVAPMILASSDPVEAEQKRLRQIEAATRGDWGDLADRVHSIKAKGISGEMSVEDVLVEMRSVRTEKLEATIPMAHTVHRGRHDQHPEVIEASFALAGGLTNPEKHYSEQVLDAADKMRNCVSLQQIILAEAVRKGYAARPGERITQGNLRQVLTAAFHPEIRATGFSTSDVSSITSNVANKFLHDGWIAVDQTCLHVAAIKPAKDFKTMTTVSLTGGTSFEKVGAAGEIKHGTLGEQTYTNQVDTYGEILAITRQDLINDDLGALTAVPRKIGRAAMLKLNDIFWTLLLASESAGFFAAGNNNLNTGVADVTTGGLAATEKMFLNQVDYDSMPLGIMPAIILVPPTQKAAALALMNSQLVVTGANATIPAGNVWQNRFQIECSPYMEISSYTGNSTSAWYMLANPSQLPAFEIAALNGRVEPTVETADADFSQLGIQMRGYSDVGVARVEKKAAVKADGGAS